MKQLSEQRICLLKSADYIRRNGHCKHAMYFMNSACVRGAVKRSADSQFVEAAAMDLLRRFLGREPVYWNDEPQTTADMVISALESAAVQDL
jgi:hypothetical protein